MWSSHLLSATIWENEIDRLTNIYRVESLILHERRSISSLSLYLSLFHHVIEYALSNKIVRILDRSRYSRRNKRSFEQPKRRLVYHEEGNETNTREYKRRQREAAKSDEVKRWTEDGKKREIYISKRRQNRLHSAWIGKAKRMRNSSVSMAVMQIRTMYICTCII